MLISGANDNSYRVHKLNTIASFKFIAGSSNIYDSNAVIASFIFLKFKAHTAKLFAAAEATESDESNIVKTGIKAAAAFPVNVEMGSGDSMKNDEALTESIFGFAVPRS